MDYKPTKRKSAFTIILVIVFLALALTITFVIGFQAGRFEGSSSNQPSGLDSRFSLFESVYNIMNKDFYFGDDSEEYKDKLVYDAINGMVDSQGDIHTDYMTPEEVREFTGSLESNIVGVGIRYRELDGEIFVLEVLRDSPAERAGLQAGDIVTAVDGVTCKENSVEYVAKLVAGERGTDVVLTINRMGKLMDITATRDIVGTTVSSTVKDGIGVLTITSFGDKTAEEMAKHLNYLKQENVTRLIIDLRNNGGGYAQTLDEMCTYFMDNGQIVMIEEDRDGNQIVDKVRKSRKIKYDKIIILVNDNSASCSEVFTLALKENCNAIIVGTTTYGKGLAQLSTVFSDGSALKYTDVIWKSGNGVFINGEGITPDYIVRLHDALYLNYLNLDDGEVYRYDQVNGKVYTAQVMLDFLGYSVDRQDGYFSEATRDAITAFQKNNGLEVNGLLDKRTASAIDSKVVSEWGIHKDKYDTQMHKALELAKQ